MMVNLCLTRKTAEIFNPPEFFNPSLSTYEERASVCPGLAAKQLSVEGPDDKSSPFARFG